MRNQDLFEYVSLQAIFAATMNAVVQVDLQSIKKSRPEERDVKSNSRKECCGCRVRADLVAHARETANQKRDRGKENAATEVLQRWQRAVVVGGNAVVAQGPARD